LSNAILTTASTAGFPSFAENRFLQRICIALVVLLVVSGIHPDTYFDWALENGAIVLGLLPLMIFTYRRMPFSDLSYLLMFLFTCIHEFGAHYKYSDVPIGEWLKPILHTQRNHYDRIAHFSFGLMFAYPMREVAMRAIRTHGKWLYLLPIECTLALSAFYEMLEAFMASVLTPQRGEEFVGMQGDMWDSQEDMATAALGSIVAVIIIAILVTRRARLAAERELAALSIQVK
jgi:putative membrane protein